MPKKIYTSEQYEWIKSQEKYFKTLVELNCAFNEHFGTTVSYSKFRSVCEHQGITRKQKRPRRLFSCEEKQWIADNRKLYTKKDLTTLFNQTFDAKVNIDVIKYLCKRMDIDETAVVNAVEKSCWNVRDLLSEKVNPRGEYYMKTENGWVLKRRYVYEQTHNVKLRDDELVCIISNDKTNFDDDNLTIMTPSQVNMLVQNNWYGVHPDITKAGLLYHDTLNAIGCNRLR